MRPVVRSPSTRKLGMTTSSRTASKRVSPLRDGRSKACREGRAQLTESYVHIRDGEAWFARRPCIPAQDRFNPHQGRSDENPKTAAAPSRTGPFDRCRRAQGLHAGALEPPLDLAAKRNSTSGSPRARSSTTSVPPRRTETGSGRRPGS